MRRGSARIVEGLRHQRASATRSETRTVSGSVDLSMPPPTRRWAGMMLVMPNESRRRVAGLVAARRARSRRRTVAGIALGAISFAVVAAIGYSEVQRSSGPPASVDIPERDAVSATTSGNPQKVSDGEIMSTRLRELQGQLEAQRAEIASLQTALAASNEPVTAALKTAEDARDADRAEIDETRSLQAELQALILSVRWSFDSCRSVGAAIREDYGRAIRRMEASLARGQVLASDRRLMDTLDLCERGTNSAWVAACTFHDDEECRHIMLGIYATWNECRRQLGLSPVRYGSLPDRD